MNTVNCYVTKVLSAPYRKFGAVWVDVEYEAYGGTRKTRLMFRTEESAKNAAVGYHFRA